MLAIQLLFYAVIEFVLPVLRGPGSVQGLG